MALLLSKEMVVQASQTAVVIIDKTRVHVVERQTDGGLVCDISPNYTCFPVSMVRKQLDDSEVGKVTLSGGDWTVIPYVRDSNGKEIKTDGEYKSYEIEVFSLSQDDLQQLQKLLSKAHCLLPRCNEIFVSEQDDHLILEGVMTEMYTGGFQGYKLVNGIATETDTGWAN